MYLYCLTSARGCYNVHTQFVAFVPSTRSAGQVRLGWHKQCLAALLALDASLWRAQLRLWSAAAAVPAGFCRTVLLDRGSDAIRRFVEWCADAWLAAARQGHLCALVSCVTYNV